MKKYLIVGHTKASAYKMLYVLTGETSPNPYGYCEQDGIRYYPMWEGWIGHGFRVNAMYVDSNITQIYFLEAIMPMLWQKDDSFIEWY